MTFSFIHDLVRLFKRSGQDRKARKTWGLLTECTWWQVMNHNSRQQDCTDWSTSPPVFFSWAVFLMYVILKKVNPVVGTTAKHKDIEWYVFLCFGHVYVSICLWTFVTSTLHAFLQQYRGVYGLYCSGPICLQQASHLTVRKSRVASPAAPPSPKRNFLTASSSMLSSSTVSQKNHALCLWVTLTITPNWIFELLHCTALRGKNVLTVWQSSCSHRLLQCAVKP